MQKWARVSQRLHFKGEAWVAWVGGLLFSLLTTHWDWHGIRGGGWFMLLIGPLYILPDLARWSERLLIGMAWAVSIVGIMCQSDYEITGMPPLVVSVACYLIALMLTVFVLVLRWQRRRAAKQ